MIARLPLRPAIVYPESDGAPIAENTLQFEWIVTVKGGCDALFRDEPNVFVAGDLLWYPVEGNPTICTAPDTMVVFGRPKGHRRSYLQWEEGGIAPQVVFEILSPGNSGAPLMRKFHFYEHYGVEEYYIYDPEDGSLAGWIRKGDQLSEIPQMQGWVSPRLGVRFELDGINLILIRPDGKRFASYLELVEEAEREQTRANEEQRRANEERERADEERQLAEEARQRADKERQRADEERQRADEERQRADKLRAQLKSLGIEPEL
jgi:Uma2 family endonuclease